MPIKPELRKFYGREWAEEIRPAILKRAGNRCEQCRVPNGVSVFRAGGMWRLTVCGAPWHRDNGKVTTFQPSNDRVVCIVLTIAHLNHISGDDRPENLKALCQWCHLDFDKDHHAETRSIRKDATRPLLSNALSPDGHQMPAEAKIEENTSPSSI